MIWQIGPAPKNRIAEVTMPIPSIRAKEALKIRWASAYSSVALFSEIIFEIAVGIPAVDRVSKKT